MGQAKNRTLFIVGLAIAAGIFISDVYTPLGIADGVSYVIVVLLTLWSARKIHTIGAAVIATILTALGIIFSPAGEDAMIFMTNRVLAVVAIWSTASAILYFKHSQAEQKRMRDSLNALFTHATEGIIITDGTGKIEMINPEAEKQFGYAHSELIGKSIEVLVPDRVSHMHHQKRVNYSGDTRSRVMGAGLELSAKRKDGSEFPVEISLSTYMLDNQKFVVAFVIDITERKKREVELKQSHEELRQYSTMLKETNAELESFAYISSHDLQEPLRKIQSFGSRLEVKESQVMSDDGKDYLARILNAAARMQNLINDLLTYSRLTTREQIRNEVDLNQLAREVISDMEVAIEKNNARVSVDPLPIISGEPTQIRQLFQNLIANAIKFRKPDVEPLIHISSRELSIENRPYIELQFEDNGIGFDQKYAEKIFGIFQQLQGSKYEGSGIGLTICKKIAARHGGMITVKSTPGQGTTFYVTIPVTPINAKSDSYATEIENN